MVIHKKEIVIRETPAPPAPPAPPPPPQIIERTETRVEVQVPEPKPPRTWLNGRKTLVGLIVLCVGLFLTALDNMIFDGRLFVWVDRLNSLTVIAGSLITVVGAGHKIRKGE
jgi:hypothetical protein